MVGSGGDRGAIDQPFGADSRFGAKAFIDAPAWHVDDSSPDLPDGQDDLTLSTNKNGLAVFRSWAKVGFHGGSLK